MDYMDQTVSCSVCGKETSSIVTRVCFACEGKAREAARKAEWDAKSDPEKAIAMLGKRSNEGGVWLEKREADLILRQVAALAAKQATLLTPGQPEGCELPEGLGIVDRLKLSSIDSPEFASLMGAHAASPSMDTAWAVLQYADKRMHEIIRERAALAARHAPAEPAPPFILPVPEGWKLVPIEPTQEMLLTAHDYDVFDKLRAVAPSAISLVAKSIYKGMLAAAPALQEGSEQPPEHQQEGQPAALCGTGRTTGCTLSGWISVEDRLPPAGEMVLVYAPNGPHDYLDTIRISFDCIDPEDDDASSWAFHNENYEHYRCVAGPDMVGPSERAPYTHWMPSPAAPVEQTTSATAVAETQNIMCGGCGETDPDKRCIGCGHVFAQASAPAGDAKEPT